MLWVVVFKLWVDKGFKFLLVYIFVVVYEIVFGKFID